MGTRYSALVLGLVLGPAALLLASAGAADAPTAKQIAQLIEQLGSNNYQEREQATRKLSEIGRPAVEALRKAAASGDPEVKQRAEELIYRLEEQLHQAERHAESVRLLTASKIHLHFAETPLPHAVADFAKNSGYTILLLDPENKLSERKVTLNTGTVTFWQAFDQFCTAASLVDASLLDLRVPRQPPGRLPPSVRPPEVPNPNLPRQPVPPAGGGVAPPAPVPRTQIQPTVVPAALAALGATHPGVILLKDGKPVQLPTCYSGSVRIRALPGKPRIGMSTDPSAPDDQLVIAVEARAEPRMQLQRITAVKVTKAVNDKNQRLEQVAVDPSPANAQAPGLPGRIIIGRAAGGRIPNRAQPIIPSPILPVRLTKALNDSQTLKELSGTLTTQALLPSEPLMTVENILKAGGKSYNIKDGTTLRVIEIIQSNDGKVTLSVQLNSPDEAGPFVPLVSSVAPNPRRAADSLKLLDDKGKVISHTQSGVSVAKVGGGQRDLTYTLSYQLQKGQVPAKLVYTGSRSVTLDIAFTLKDVPVK